MKKHRYNIGDTIKCVKPYSYFKMGDLITIDGVDGGCVRFIDNGVVYELGYTYPSEMFGAGTYTLPYSELDHWVLEDEQVVTNEKIKVKSELQRFMEYLSNRDNLTTHEFDLVRRYQWFLRDGGKDE